MKPDSSSAGEARPRGTTSADRRRLVLCALAAGVGAVFTILCFYPGYMSFDSIVQLTEARSGLFTDQHPPLMALVWRALDRITPGPQGMLLIHNGLFWSGAAVLCYVTARWTWLATGAVLFLGLFAPNFALLSTIWKDVSLGCSLLLAFALLLHSDRTNSKRSLLVSALPLIYALSVRHNSVLAVLPLVLLGGILASRQFLPSASVRAGLLTGLLVFGVMFACVELINRSLVNGRRTFIYQASMLHDLAALSLARSSLSIPAPFYWNQEAPALEDLRKIYDPVNVAPLYAGTPFSRPLKFTSDPEESAVLRKAWLLAILRAPRPYLEHRWIMFKVQLALGGQSVCYPYAEGIEENSLGVIWRPSRLNDWALAYLAKFRETLLFRGWVYVLITIVLLIATRSLPARPLGPALALGVSSLLYEFAYFFVSPACDFRYNWWTVVATLALGLSILPAPRNGLQAKPAIADCQHRPSGTIH